MKTNRIKILLPVYLLYSLVISAGACQPVDSGQRQAMQTVPRANADSVQLSLWVSGALPDPYYHEAEQCVARQYGYVVRHLGCTLNDSIENAITKNNKHLIQQLQQTHPGITLDHLINEMQHHVSITKSIENVVVRVLDKRMKAKPHHPYSRLTWNTAPEKGWYIVAVYTSETDESKADSLYCLLKINPKTDDYMLQNDKGEWVEL